VESRGPRCGAAAILWIAGEFASANSCSLSPVKRKANADPRGVRIVFTPDRTRNLGHPLSVALEWMAREFARANSDGFSDIDRKPERGPQGPHSALHLSGRSWNL